jgi:tetratricopeptide (TPR) repeat protein
MLFALEKIEDAIKLDKQWYHFFYKAIWLYESEKKTDAAKVVIYGLNLDKAKKFFFSYLGADSLFKDALVLANNIGEADKSITELDQAIRALYDAEHLFLENSKDIESARQSIPKELKDLCPTFLNSEDLVYEVRSFRTKIEMIKQSVILFKAMVQTENRVNAAIQENRQRIDLERVRTIELLGVFTAILAFIFSGVQIFIKIPFTEAIVLEIGLALLLIIFLLVLHMVLDPEARTKHLITILIILITILIGLPLYGGWLRNLSCFKQNIVPNTDEQKTQIIMDKKQ